MNQEFLKTFGLDDEACAAILGEHGKDVQAAAAAGEEVGAEKLKTHMKKLDAVNGVLSAAGVVRESFRKALLATWDIDGVEFDEGGEIKNRDALISCIKTDYPDFIAQTTVEGVPPLNPPMKNMTPEAAAWAEQAERGRKAAAIAEAYHREMFGSRND